MNSEDGQVSPNTNVNVTVYTTSGLVGLYKLQ